MPRNPKYCVVSDNIFRKCSYLSLSLSVPLSGWVIDPQIPYSVARIRSQSGNDYVNVARHDCPSWKICNLQSFSERRGPPTAFISIEICPSSPRTKPFPFPSLFLSCARPLVQRSLVARFMNINSVLPKYNAVTPLSLERSHRSLHSKSETLLSFQAGSLCPRRPSAFFILFLPPFRPDLSRTPSFSATEAKIFWRYLRTI